LFGISRQAYYKGLSARRSKIDSYKQVLDLVVEKRIRMPRIGTRKLYYLLANSFKYNELKIGRDQLFDILRANNMLVKVRKSYQKTTDSKHWLKKYSNLIKDLDIKRPEQVWVSDITYIPTEEGHNYLSLVTDTYSKQIMGYHLSEDLKAEGCVRALQMAIMNRKYDHPLIHHSDRGVQYCSKEYQSLLVENSIKPSMCEQYDPYENAVAERVNGILKDEFSIERAFSKHLEAVNVIKESIMIYNHERPHLSCQMMTPAKMHGQRKITIKKWKKKSSKTVALEL
jgi:transposase InsO family protein